MVKQQDETNPKPGIMPNLASPLQQPETIIEIRPYRGGWQCFEGPITRGRGKRSSVWCERTTVAPQSPRLSVCVTNLILLARFDDGR